jgi:hypothetical protein
MAGFGSLYSGMDDENFDYSKEYDPNEVFPKEVFGRFGGDDNQAARVSRSTVTTKQNGVIVERRKSRSYKLPY